jgi:hypothetical protein
MSATGGTPIYIPTLASMKGAVMAKKTIMAVLAVIFVASLIGLVSSGYSSDHINKSSCGSTDANAVSAKKWATGTAVIDALIMAGSLVTIGYLLFVHSRASQ